VLKLGYEAPRTGLHVAECFAEAGLPAGVLNVLTGSGSKVGAEIVSNPGVRAISFTGSVPVGRSVRDEATARDCRVQLELGGHNPLIVTGTAELDRAVEAAYAGAFWSAGQKCTATRRILVEGRYTTTSATSCSHASRRARSAIRPIRRSRSARSSTRAHSRTSSARSSALEARVEPCSPAASAPTTTAT
jgi:acyl-CoA reductase-like NAD-dependent aldehyde dehydrogenase